MISLEDCLALCGLTKDEVLALAEHEHIPEIAAAALGQYLLNQPNGCKTIRDMIAEDIRWARGRGDGSHAQELTLTLQHFVSSHPEVGGLPLRAVNSPVDVPGLGLWSGPYFSSTYCPGASAKGGNSLLPGWRAPTISPP